MSVLKLFFGFVVGLIACAILLGLVSIRSPILAGLEMPSQQIGAEVNVAENENSEQTINIELEGAVDINEVDTETALIVENGVSDDELEQENNTTNVDAENSPTSIEAKPVQDEPKPQTPVVVEPVPATVLKRAGSTLTLGSGSSRLPSVSSITEGTTAEEDVSTEVVTIFASNSNPLIELDTPYMSIILVDIGSAGVSQSDLLKETMPLTFAIDGSRSDANRVAGDYRAAGFEIITLLNEDVVADLTTADDAIVTVQAYLDAVPMALAIVDAPSARLQKNRRFFDPVLASIANVSPGFLTYKGGLGTAATATQDAGLPTGVITRYLDETYQSPSIIKRAIDRTTVEAAKNGAAILMAVATPAVLQGIAQWADTSAASKVELVPVSSSMARQKP